MGLVCQDNWCVKDCDVHGITLIQSALWFQVLMELSGRGEQGQGYTQIIYQLIEQGGIKFQVCGHIWHITRIMDIYLVYHNAPNGLGYVTQNRIKWILRDQICDKFFVRLLGDMAVTLLGDIITCDKCFAEFIGQDIFYLLITTLLTILATAYIFIHGIISDPYHL